MTDRPCASGCGRPVTGTSQRRYCSKECKKRAEAAKRIKKFQLQCQLPECRNKVRSRRDRFCSRQHRNAAEQKLRTSFPDQCPGCGMSLRRKGRPSKSAQEVTA